MNISDPWMILFEILINFYEGALYVFFCNSVFHSSKRHCLWAALFSVLIGIAYSLYSFFDIPLTDACVFILPIIYSLIVSDSPPIECIFWNIIMGTIVFGCVNLCYVIYTMLLGSSISYLLAADSARIPYVIFTNLLITGAIVLLIIQKKRCLYEKISLILLSVINIISISIVDILYLFYDVYNIPDQWVLFISLLSFCISVLSIMMYRIISAYVEKETEHKKILLIQQNNEKELENIQKNYESMSSLRHDLNNHINILYKMFENGEIEHGKAYISNLQKDIVRTFNTGCRPLDCLIMLKDQELQKTKASFHCHLGNLKELPMDESSFCAIVSNILDNAIEAIRRQEDYTDDLDITLQINRIRNMLYINCSNTILPKMIKREGDLFVSSKRFGNAPGIGLENVKSMVYNASGEYMINIDDKTFNISIMIPYQNS